MDGGTGGSAARFRLRCFHVAPVGCLNDTDGGGFGKILSFADKSTAAVHRGECPKGFPVAIFAVARRKLAMVDAAPTLDTLRMPPGNRLHALAGDRAEQHAIRINDQYRVCFRWTEAGPAEVEIVDSH